MTPHPSAVANLGLQVFAEEEVGTVPLVTAPQVTPPPPKEKGGSASKEKEGTAEPFVACTQCPQNNWWPKFGPTRGKWENHRQVEVHATGEMSRTC